jgi:hypothetical protein
VLTSSSIPANGEYLPAANTIGWATNGTQRATINATGNVVINAPTAGNTLALSTFAGSSALVINAPASGTTVAPLVVNSFATNGLSIQAGDQAGNLWDVGWRDTPQNSFSTAYTLALADRGKQLLAVGGAYTITIPANASVAFPIGTVISIVNPIGSSPKTIAITTDTLNWSPTGAAGSRTLAAAGVATLLKIAATIWYVTGVGIS